jgi:hypothetical protein
VKDAAKGFVARQKEIALFEAESPALFERASVAAEKYGWDIAEIEVENSLAYLVSRDMTPVAALRWYVALLEKGERRPASDYASWLAGYYVRKKSGRLTSEDHRRWRNRQRLRFLTFLVLLEGCFWLAESVGLLLLLVPIFFVLAFSSYSDGFGRRSETSLFRAVLATLSGLVLTAVIVSRMPALGLFLPTIFFAIFGLILWLPPRRGGGHGHSLAPS